MKLKYFRFLIIGVFFILSSCTKETTLINEEINAIPYYGEIPTNRVENYVNRVFIDLINREPTDVEMDLHVSNLRAAELSMGARENLIKLLHTDTTYREGDVSYKHLYYHWFYEKVKSRVLENATDAEIKHELGLIEQALLRDSLNGDTASSPFKKLEVTKLSSLLGSEEAYRNGEIGFKDMYSYMVNNKVFDILNMNTFNFINACFDYYFYRFPTQAEFNASFEIIEYNSASTILNAPASNKTEYVNALVNSKEFYNGMVSWAYYTLLQRDATSLEMSGGTLNLLLTNDFQKTQMDIMKTDEYAQFTPIYKAK